MSKRKVLSVKDKVNIIKLSDLGEKNVTICKEYGLTSSTVSTLLKNRESLLKAFEANVTECKRLKKCEKADLDETLLKWFIQQQNAGLPVSGPIMKSQAESFAVQLGYEHFTCSNGWLQRFKKRHNIYSGKINTEATCADVGETSEWLNTVWKDLRENYSDEDIYNANEACIFYNLTPNQTVKFKGEKCIGEKLLKSRLTLLVCSNMSGKDKRKLLVIGKSADPICFKGVECFPVTYKSNAKAMMTADVFTIYVREWDEELRNMNRKIMLVVDDCQAHPHVEDLTNIKLVLLPPSSTTTIIQPMDQGIIHSLKSRYRRELNLLLSDRTEKKMEAKISILDAIRLMADAWEGVSQPCIQTCFKKSGWGNTDSDTESEIDRRLSLWLRQKHIEHFSSISNNDMFVHIDDAIVMPSTLASEGTLESIDPPKNSIKQIKIKKEIEEITVQPPSHAIAVESIKNLEHFFEAVSGIDEHVLNALSTLRQKLNEHECRETKQPIIHSLSTSK